MSLGNRLWLKASPLLLRFLTSMGHLGQHEPEVVFMTCTFLSFGSSLFLPSKQWTLVFKALTLLHGPLAHLKEAL